MSLVARTNAVRNPIGANVAATTNLVATRVTAAAMSGFIRCTITDASIVANVAQRLTLTGPLPVATPGQVVRILGEGRSDVTVPSLAVRLEFLTSGLGSILVVEGTPGTVNGTGGAFSTIPTLEATAPATTAFVQGYWGVGGTGARANGQIFDLRRIMVEVGSSGDYFDGSFADTDTIDYAWTGTAELSASTATSKVRVAINDVRTPQAQASVRASTF